ncbi:protein-disulfide reductase DsbD domain-containing protein [Pedobacter sp.]|uniref:protein-disulfide reductase DsbD domain-containing protein n=1 Tax=Pedobacter sp. TaxID=1411316 RepID=UPI0031DE6088
MKVRLIFFLLLSSFFAQAQLHKPVKWSYLSKKLNNNEAEIYLKASISTGWHIYAMQFNEAPMRTSFRFTPSPSYALIGKVKEPKSVAKYDKTFKKNLYYFEKEVVFAQKIKLLKPKVSVKGILEFMACSDKSCLPAEEVPFQIVVSR